MEYGKFGSAHRRWTRRFSRFAQRLGAFASVQTIRLNPTQRTTDLFGGAVLPQPPIHTQDGQSRHVAPSTRRQFSSWLPLKWLALRLAMRQARLRDFHLEPGSNCDRVVLSACPSRALDARP